MLRTHNKTEIVQTLNLFPELNAALIHLLQGIGNAEWLMPSPIIGRTVKDLASHILDGTLRRLSMQRDNFLNNTGVQLESYDDLVAYIQALNKEWIIATRRISPAILIELLELFEDKVYQFFSTLDLYAEAPFAVAWAGETRSANWFDIAREYTEKWHHQMQIRRALDRPLLMEHRFIEPLYATFFLGLPHLFRDIDSISADAIAITISDAQNGHWFLIKDQLNWRLTKKKPASILSHVSIPADIGWILFTNTDRDKAKYREQISIEGNKELGEKVLDLVAVMS